MITTDLHSASALFNPYLLQDKELADDSDVITTCRRVLQNLCTPETYLDVVQEFLAFRHKDVSFHDMLDPKQQKCSPYAWWDFEGACGKLLAPIVKRILVQTVSSSSCECNWSSYSFVHDRKWNQLLPRRADDLVFVYTNSRLLANAKLMDEKRWYAENLDLEDPQPHESDDLEYSDDFSIDAIAAYSAEHLDDDIESDTPPMDNIHTALGLEYDFVDADVLENKVDDFVPIRRVFDGDGVVNTENILHPGSIPIPELTKGKEEEGLSSSQATLLHGHKMQGPPIKNVEGYDHQDLAPPSTLKQTTTLSFLDDTVVLHEKTMKDGSNGGPSTLLHCVQKNTSFSKEQPSFQGTL